MKIRLSTLILAIVLIAPAALVYAQTDKTITLKDGSTLKGNVTELKDGVYTVETTTIGQVTIPESNISSITSSSSANAQNQNASSGSDLQKAQLKQQVQQIQGSILSDKGVMTGIQGLLEDDSIKAMLSDPKLVEDVMSFDQHKIENNSNIKSLMDNPKMQELMETIQKKIPAQ